MATEFKSFTKPGLLAGLCLAFFAAGVASGQEVITTEMTTSEVRTLMARVQHATLIQLPVEPLATSVGDPSQWLVEKQDRWVSIKPIVQGPSETTLGIITRIGTLNFIIKPVVGDGQAFTQNLRVTAIQDDSKPLPPVQTSHAEGGENRAAIFIREIRVAQNYFALLQTRSPMTKNVQHHVLLKDTSTPDLKVSLLQTFRFLDTRDILLHFTIKNISKEALNISSRETTVSLQKTIFAPKAVSLGATEIPPGRSTENFIVLDGTLGLNPNQPFEINLSTHHENDH